MGSERIGAVLRLETLGVASVELIEGQGSRGTMGTGKPLALMTYLACSPRRSESREHLLNLLWSDVDADAGRHALRQTIWYIKRKLGEPVVTNKGNELTLAVSPSLDRDEFLAAAQEQNWPRAIELYRGDFFAGFAVPGGAEFERWAESERHRLKVAFMRSLEQYALHHLAHGRFREAQATARRLRDAEPFRQSSWRLLIESLSAGREQIQAGIELDALERLLDSEGLDAEPETTRTIRTVRKQRFDDVDQKTTHPVAAELIAREREFSTLLALWEQAREGDTASALIVAEAGIGKTRLLQDFGARLKASRARVVSFRATQANADIAFSLVGDLVGLLAKCPGSLGVTSTVTESLVALNPAVSAVYLHAGAEKSADEDVMRRRTVAVRELLCAIADEQPFALLIDDLHWADAASRRLLAACVSSLEGRRVLVVMASRPPLTARFTDSTVVLQLRPLEKDHVARLLTSIASLPVGSWTDELVQRLYAAAGGNPLLLLETLQLACERGAIAISPEREWQLQDHVVLRALLGDGAALSRRLESISDAERTLLLTLTVAGVALKENEVADIAPSSMDHADVLRSLAARGLVSQTDDCWRIIHDAYATVILGEAHPETVRAVHERIGLALLASSGGTRRTVDRAGAHLAAAGRIDSLVPELSRRVAYARRTGDRRHVVEIAGELLGASAPHSLRHDLSRRTPWYVRAGIVTRNRIGAVGILLLMLLGAGAAGSRSILVDSDVTLTPGLVVISSTAEGGSMVRAYSIEANDVRPRRNFIGTQLRWNYPDVDAAALFLGAITPTGWIVSLTSPDSGGWDLYELPLSGQKHRLTFDPADDHGPSVSPDGRRIVFATGRFDPELNRDDAATMERDGSAPMQLAGSRDIENGTRWSPDGSRIAFLRTHMDRTASSVCIVTSDGIMERCSEFKRQISNVVGWTTTASLLLVFKQPNGQSTLEEYYLESDSIWSTGIVGENVRLSPDGILVTCRCKTTSERIPEWRIFTTRDFREFAQLSSVLHDSAVQYVTWLPGSFGTRWLDSLLIASPAVQLARGEPFALQAHAIDQRGKRFAINSLRWEISDSSIASIDDNGVLSATAEGEIEVLASTGGWRSARRRLRIGPPRRFQTVFQESWDDDWATRWQPFGDPVPYSFEEAGVRWFAANGDRKDVSGAISRADYSLGSGLAVTAEFRTPMSREQWQRQFIGFWGMKRDLPSDSAALSQPVDSLMRAATMHCGFTYAAGDEGHMHLKQWALSAGATHENSMERFHAPESWKTGRGYLVSVRILADGRCQVGVDGQTLHTSSRRLDTSMRYRIVVDNQSMWTRLHVGRVLLERGM